MSEWKPLLLDQFIRDGSIELGRGNIISRVDIYQDPGPYPIYSSSAKGDGAFGHYGSYMFDEELITWSVDGGGRLFYRPKHKFSVTNVSGYLRIKSHDLDYRFVHYMLDHQHGEAVFDYQDKAHPSVIRSRYYLVPLPIQEQRKIAAVLTTVDNLIERTEALIAKYEAIKQGMMHDLFTRGVDENGQLRPPHHEAPHLYKDSPLGPIPKEWSSLSLEDIILHLESGVSVNSDETPGYDSPAMILKTSCLTGCKFRPDEAKPIIKKDLHRAELNPRQDTIIISRMNTVDLIGENAYVDKDYPDLFLPDRLWMTVFKSDAKLHVRWLAFLLSSRLMRSKISALATGTSGSMKNISQSSFLGIAVKFPWLEEQREIANRLERINAYVDSLKDDVQSLHKLKSGLMQDLLTGKVRVPVDEVEEASDV
ncbi:restriction endonuclease subunit S [bacterium]|nr:restriction endonuclease subunit S [bacterium]